MKFISTVINVGAEKPFERIHFSDIHLTYADERDDRRKLALAAERRRYFADAQANLDAVIAEAKRTGALLVSTGDLIDFVSFANLDAARKFTGENDCFFAAGNHEFSLYVGEAFEDAEYRSRSLETVQSAFKNDIRFSARAVNGVNIIAVDNGYYLIDRPQLNALKSECQKGLPVILLMHTPLHTDALCSEMLGRRGEPCAYLMGSPESVIAAYSSHRARQQRPDAITREAFDYICSEPAIKAILAGHIHGEHIEDEIRPGLTQYIVGTDTARRITIM